MRTWSSTRRIWRTRTRTTKPERDVGAPAPAPLALGLGANLPGPWGSPRRTLRHALERLEDALGPLRAAPLYRTAPLTLPGAPPQDDYLNTAAVGSTTLEPLEVLRLAKALEREAGRDPAAERWAPRPLDVDLLVYGDLCGEWSGEVAGEPARLTLPHPGLRRRAFVLVPLADVAPGLPVPPDGRTVAELLAALRSAGDAGGVEPVGD